MLQAHGMSTCKAALGTNKTIQCTCGVEMFLQQQPSAGRLCISRGVVPAVAITPTILIQ